MLIEVNMQGELIDQLFHPQVLLERQSPFSACLHAFSSTFHRIIIVDPFLSWWLFCSFQQWHLVLKL